MEQRPAPGGKPIVWYCGGVRNNGERTLHNVTLHARESEFTVKALAPNFGQRSFYESEPVGQDREPTILGLDELHPGATEVKEMFGDSQSGPPVFDVAYKFTLEARARDTRTVTAEFVYDPNKTPRIQRVA